MTEESLSTIVDTDERQERAGYVAWMVGLIASFAHAPCRIGGAKPFFRPKWVDSYERAHRGWGYEEQLAIGRGACLFPTVAGAFLLEQFKDWSRKAQGGVLEFNEQFNVFRFVPDRDADSWQRIVVAGRPRKKLLLPNALNPASSGPALILPGRA